MRSALSHHWRTSSKAAVGGLLFGLVLAIPATPVAAQGTPQQRAACEQDAYRLCNQFIPDEDRTANCLRRNRLRLSPACRTLFSGKRARPRSRSRR
jgi:hypothetical protein